MKNEVKEYLDSNPQDADNAEDLSNWAADKFNLTDSECDAAYKYCRDKLGMPK
jgi:hypothetical protein